MKYPTIDLKKEIFKEHSKLQTLKIVKYIGNSTQRFHDLIKVLVKGPYHVSQRAAWPLSVCIEHHPELILPHLSTVLKLLNRKDMHEAVKRNVVRLLQYVDIPKRYYGKVAGTCFELLDPKEPIAVRASSMTVLANIAVHEPDLKKELRIVIEDQLPYASAGFRARARKILKSI